MSQALRPGDGSTRRRRLLAEAGLRRATRAMPSATSIVVRRRLIQLTKLSLPLLALALLGSLAAWPEWQRDISQAQQAAARLATVHGDTVLQARYRSVDERGRPYTVTAASARQAGPNRVDLVDPKGDITLQNGTWLMLQSKAGVYRQTQNELDLSAGVTLYRDDGTTMHTRSAAIDLKNGAAAGSQPVHAEGPFGRLEASSGFTATDKGESIFFAGPAQLMLNGASAQ